MSTHHEVERLQAVYHTYRENQTIQAKWSERNLGNRAIVQERTRKVGQMLQTGGFWPLTDQRILDVGCGVGDVLYSLIQWGAKPDHLYGVDLLPERIMLARQRFPDIHFQHANAEQLDFVSATFDLVFLYTVFSSILDAYMAHNVTQEIERVLKPGGGIIWYDFRYDNPGNTHVRGMSKEAIRHRFPNFSLYLQTITLLPPLARRLGWGTPVLYSALSLIPWLRTHYLGLLLKPEMYQ